LLYCLNVLVFEEELKAIVESIYGRLFSWYQDNRTVLVSFVFCSCIINEFEKCFFFIFKVRTQRLPHPSFHPPGIPMHQFVPHIGPSHFPPEMYAIAHGPGFDPMFHPPFVEYLHPGMI
jgi:hypothetical protein